MQRTRVILLRCRHTRWDAGQPMNRLSFTKIFLAITASLLGFGYGLADDRLGNRYRFGRTERRQILEATNSWKVIGFSDIVLFRLLSDASERVSVWTNTRPIFDLPHEPRFNSHQGFAATDMSNKIVIAYKEGPILFAEVVSTNGPAKERERFWLARDSSANPTTWTNAFFSRSTNSGMVLTAESDRGGQLTWGFRGNLLVLLPETSRPDDVRDFAWQDWCVVSFQTNGWVVKLKNTNSLPALDKN